MTDTGGAGDGSAQWTPTEWTPTHARSGANVEARLEDRWAITEQMYRYARATDWLQTEDHRQVFADGCVFASPHSGEMHGVDAVVAWMNRALAPFEATQHLIGNITITFTGDTSATAVSYVRAWHRYRDRDRPDMVLWGEYHDRWTLAGPTWRIAQRHVLEAGIEPASRRRCAQPAPGAGMTSGEPNEGTLQHLADRAAVHDLLVRLALAQDARDWAALADCFVPTARYVHPGGELAGVDDIVARTRAALTPLDDSQHLLGTILVQLHGADPDQGSAVAYFQAQHVRRGLSGGELYVIAGTYRDRVVRCGDGRWRIALRTQSYTWRDGNPDVIRRTADGTGERT